MHAVAAVFASIITFVSGFFGSPLLASNSPINVPTTQPAAAAAAQAEIVGDPFNDPAAASAVVATIPPAAPSPAFSPPQAQTVINQPVIERIIERVVPQGTANVSTEALAAILADFERSISSRIAALNPPKATIPEQVAAAGNATGAFFSASQRIDQLTSTSINAPTITGGSISGASVSGYLSLSGGTLTGTLSGTDLSLSGVLTAGTLSVAGVSSGGAVFAPYFTATSTTATSTFAGGFTAANSSFSILQNGNAGIGTAAPNIAGGNSNSRVLSIVGDGTLVNARGVLELANPRASGSLAANDTAGSAFFVMSNNSGNSYIAGILGSLSGSGGANGFGGKLQFQTKADNAASSATTKMVLDQNGNIGIGTTTPAKLLDIYGAAAGLSIDASSGNPSVIFKRNSAADATIATAQAAGQVIAGSATGDLAIRSESHSILFSTNSGTTAHMAIGTNGNVGIGTTSPEGGLHVVRGVTGAESKFYFQNGTTAANGSASIGLYPNSVTSRGAEIQALAESPNVTDLIFKTNSSGAAPAERVRITNSGNVGIGTTSPAAKLEVSSSGSGNPVSFYMDGDRGLLNAQAGNIGFRNKSTNIASIDGYTGATGGSINYGQLVFSTANSGSLIERMRITESGNVGIGTTSPTNKLEVAGNTFLGGTITGTSTLALTGTTGTTTIATGQGFTIGGSQFVVQQGSGNVGIGTTTPGSRFHVDMNSASGISKHLGLTDGAGLADWRPYLGNSTTALQIQSSATDGLLLVPTTGSNSTGGNLITSGDFRIYSNATVGTNIGTLGLAVSSGNVGIGTTTPWGKLSVTGSGTGTGLAFAVADSANTPRFVIQDNGSVGIGTTSPTNNLTVERDANSAAIMAVRNTTSGTIAQASFGADLSSGFTDHYISGGITSASYSGTYNNLAYLQSKSVPMYLGTTVANSLNLFTNGITNPRLTIDSSGNVGIGTTTPGGILEVGNTSSSGIVSNFTNGNSAATAYTELGVRNGYTVGNNADALRLLTFSTGWTTTGGFVQDGAALEAGVNLSGGLSMVARNSAGVLRFYTGGQADSNERMRITSTGNVGIGTTSPFAKLHIATSNSGASAISSGADELALESNGSTGMSILAGTASDASIFFGDSGSPTMGRIVYANNGDALSLWTTATQRMTIDTSGNVGIGTSSPTAQLHTTGTVRFSNFGAGTLTTDASGNLSVSSDERLKNIDGEFTRGLADIVQLNPISYHWNATSGLDMGTQYAGFSAQNVQAAIPEAVGSSTNGYLTLQDRPLIAALVNAVKEIAQRFTDLAERVVTKELVAVNGSFRNIRAEELCFGDSPTDESPVCLTKSQVAAVLASAGQTAVPPSTTAPAGTPQAPVIELNGNATSPIEVGDTYNDLGARIVAPDSDLNLGIVILLDGATTTAVSIDTSTPGEHIILYTVTSPTTDLTGSIMRTVIVSPAEQPSAPAEDSNPFNSPEPENDNASTTLPLAI